MEDQNSYGDLRIFHDCHDDTEMLQKVTWLEKRRKKCLPCAHLMLRKLTIHLAVNSFIH